MTVTINGSGTVTGISAGGLPDGVITTDDLASTVPVAKAWVNFNGTGTVAIRASYNVSGLTDHGTGEYTVSFTTSLSDSNYAVVGSATRSDGVQALILGIQSSVSAPTTSAVRIVALNDSGSNQDSLYTNVAIFR